MCGLFGGITNNLLLYREIEYIQQLGVMAQLRGVDGTGIVTVHNKKNKKMSFQTLKRVCNSSAFLSLEEATSLLYQDRVFVISGHTRKATSGEINETNAQPIHTGAIIGCHNGVIDHLSPPKALEKTRTDSRSFLEKISTDGIISAVDNIREGAYALVYIDIKDRSLNLCRNYKRPLYIMWNSDKSTLYWASEKGMLDLLRERAGTGYFFDPLSIPVNKLLTIKLGNLSITETDLPFTKPTIHSIETGVITPLRMVSVCSKCGKNDQFCFCDMYPRQETFELRVPTTVPIIKPIDTPKGDLYQWWERQIVRITEVADTLAYGCATCSRKLTADDSVMWVSPYKPVCISKCFTNKMLHQYIRASCCKMFPGKRVEGSYAKVL